jgi:hypothetical protein
MAFLAFFLAQSGGLEALFTTIPIYITTIKTSAGEQKEVGENRCRHAMLLEGRVPAIEDHSRWRQSRAIFWILGWWRWQ